MEDRKAEVAAYKGVAIAMMMNEPGPGETATSYFKGAMILTPQPHPIGTELTIHYGNNYHRDYPVGRNLSQFPSHDLIGVVDYINKKQETIGHLLLSIPFCPFQKPSSWLPVGTHPVAASPHGHWVTTVAFLKVSNLWSLLFV
jgi:hypothetical protein